MSQPAEAGLEPSLQIPYSSFYDLILFLFSFLKAAYFYHPYLINPQGVPTPKGKGYKRSL